MESGWRKQVWERDAGKGCAYCGSVLPSVVDHVVPRRYGGPNIADNGALACYTCNARKCASYDPSWMVKGFFRILDGGGSLAWINDVHIQVPGYLMTSASIGGWVNGRKQRLQKDLALVEPAIVLSRVGLESRMQRDLESSAISFAQSRRICSLLSQKSLKLSLYWQSLPLHRKLKQVRKQLRVSVDEAAQEIGMSSVVLRMCEDGRFVPQGELRRRIEEYL